MPDDIRVPTVPVDVDLLLSDGTAARVTIHLSSSSPFHDGSETLDEFFDAPRGFLPVRDSDGRTQLIGRHAIVTATAPASAPLLSRLPGRVLDTIFFLKLHLDTGEVLEGTLVANLPTAAARVSDAFNMVEEFLPLESSDTVTFVRKDRIVRAEI